MSDRDGLGLDLTPWTNLASSVAASAAQVEAARQSANAAKALSRSPAPTYAAPVRSGMSPIVLVGLLAGVGVVGYFVLPKLFGKGKRRR